DRPFTEHDVELLEVVGDRIASAIQVGQLVVERAATDLLERSLLPSRLPQCAGLSFATRYVAAAENTVGGDWYDLFTLPSGQLWIVVGDVAGHGLQAAVVNGPHSQRAPRVHPDRRTGRARARSRRHEGEPLRDRDHRHGLVRGSRSACR